MVVKKAVLEGANNKGLYLKQKMKIKDNTERKFSMLIAHLCLIPVLDYAKQSFITGFTGAYVVTSTQNN